MAFKKLTAGLMASSMILGLAQTAAAEITTATPFETAVKMNKLGVVKGVGTLPTGEIDFNLGGNLTRAELVTTIVRSFGAEQAAQLAKGAPSFADVKASEWYSGYVAVAKNLAEQAGTTIGRNSNTFDPMANVSKAEALVFVMKFLGVKVTSTGANWYEAWIAKAVELGMISQADAAIALANPGSSATRGEAFVILDFGYSAKVLEGGASLYTAYVDSVKPTVTASAAETTAETKITVSGKVSDDKAVAAVFVNGTAVEVKDGNFSAEVELKVGENSIEISATDVAGNSAAKTLKVTRTNAAAASIEAADVTVAAGAEVSVSAKLLDANGAAIADAEITGTSDLGTFAGGKFTAGTKAGEGKLTLKAGEITKDVAVKVVAGEIAGVKADKVSAAVGTKVTLTAVDAYGNAVSGATFTQESADAFISANFFTATKAGAYKVTATAGGKSVEYTVAVYSTTVAKFSVTPSVTSLVANNASEFKVVLQALDGNGNPISAAATTNTLSWDASTQSAFQMKNAAGSWVALADVTLENGTKTVTLRTTAAQVGGITQTIGVKDTAPLSTLKGSATVDLVDQVATSIGVTAPAKFLANNGGNENAHFVIKVLDQAGKPMKSGAYAFTAAVSGAGAKLVADDTDASAADSKNLFYFGGSDSANGVVANVVSSYLQSGEVTVTASATGLTSGSAKIIATTAFGAAKLDVQQDLTTAVANQIDEVEFDLEAQDANGVPVPSTHTFSAAFGLTAAEITANKVQYKIGAGGWLNVPAGGKVDVTLVGGVETFYVRSLNKTGAVKVTFTDKATSAVIAGTEKSINFVADVATKVNLVRTAAVEVAVGSPEVELVAQLSDDAGNKSTEAGKSIVFSTTNTAAKLNGAASPVTVTTDANGQAKVKVTLAAYVGEAATISVDGATGSGITVGGSANIALSVKNAIAQTMTYSLTKGGAPVSIATAGDAANPITLAVTIKDAGGRNMGAGQTLAVEVTEGDTVADITLAWNGTDAYTGTFVPTTAGRLALNVKNTSSSTELTIPVALNVRAGAFAGAKVERADYTVGTITTAKAVAQSFRIIPVDASNNLSPKVTANSVKATWTVTGVDTANGEYFEIRSSETGAAILNTAGFTMAPGTSGQSFFVLTNAANAAVTFSFTSIDPADGTTVLNHGTDAVTFQAK